MKIISKKYVDIPVDESIYDLIIEDNHNYCITENDIVVHNSGKGFVLNNVIAFDGRVFDVDKLKTSLINYAKKKPDSEVQREYERKFGKKLSDIDLKNPNDTSNLHKFVKDKGYADKEKTSLFKQAKDSKDHKPNVIFDVTLKNTNDLKEISEFAELGGYDPKNIHIVWVLSNITIARKQNADRSRSVADAILVKTHTGAATSLRDIIERSEYFRKYADGDIWIVFNVRNTDSQTVVSKESGLFKYLKNYNALHLKERGKPAKSLAEFEDSALGKKIKQYVPSGTWD